MTILNRVMAHTNIYRKIRERTRGNNESSWAAAEDSFAPLSHKIVQTYHEKSKRNTYELPTIVPTAPFAIPWCAGKSWPADRGSTSSKIIKSLLLRHEKGGILV